MIGRPKIKHEQDQLFDLEATPTCAVCRRAFPVSEFSPDSRRASGCMSRCKACQRILRNAWNAKEPQGHLAAVRRWRERHPEASLALKRVSESRRRARKASVANERIDPRVVFERDEGICGICRETVDPSDYHIDHVIPLSKGGPHLYVNVQLAHPRCNLAKGAR